jgi:hypothetical protein
MDSSGIIPGISWNWGSTYSASYIQFQKPDFIPGYGSTCRKQNPFLPSNWIPTLIPNSNPCLKILFWNHIELSNLIPTFGHYSNTSNCNHSKSTF